MIRPRQRKLILGIFVLLSMLQVQAQSTEYQNRALLPLQAQAPAQSQAASPDSSDRSRLESELQQAQDKLKDWPNLARYHDANAQVPPPARGEARVVFMGDSITDG